MLFFQTTNMTERGDEIEMTDTGRTKNNDDHKKREKRGKHSFIIVFPSGLHIPWTISFSLYWLPGTLRLPSPQRRIAVNRPKWKPPKHRISLTFGLFRRDRCNFTKLSTCDKQLIMMWSDRLVLKVPVCDWNERLCFVSVLSSTLVFTKEQLKNQSEQSTDQNQSNPWVFKSLWL